MWFIGVEVEQETIAPPPKKKSWIRPWKDSFLLGHTFCRPYHKALIKRFREIHRNYRDEHPNVTHLPPVLRQPKEKDVTTLKLSISAYEV